MVPELADFPIVKHWAGLHLSSPTGVPYIRPFPEIANLWANLVTIEMVMYGALHLHDCYELIDVRLKATVDASAYSPERLSKLGLDQMLFG